jgi:hypothetical protein
VIFSSTGLSETGERVRRSKRLQRERSEELVRVVFYEGPRVQILLPMAPILVPWSLFYEITQVSPESLLSGFALDPPLEGNGFELQFRAR